MRAASQRAGRARLAAWISSTGSPVRASARRTTSTRVPRCDANGCARISSARDCAGHPRRRSGRVSRRAHQRRPLHLGAAADRHGHRGGKCDDRPSGAPRARRRGRRAAVERRPDASRHASVEPASDALERYVRPGRSSMSYVRGRRVVAVGRIAATVLDAPYVRHPSHGGAVAFADGLRAYARRVSVPIAAPVKRNAFLLAGGLICNSGMFQLAAALSSLTLVAVTGITGILGLGPAIFLASGAIVVGPAGRFMDRVGRMPVIRGGYAFGAVGCGIVAGGCALPSAALVAARAQRARRRRRDDPAHARCGRGDVSAGSSRARHVARSLRRRVGCAVGAGRVRAALRPSGDRRPGSRRPVARRHPVHDRRSRDRLVRPAGPEGDRGVVPGRAGRARRPPSRSARSCAGRAFRLRCSRSSRASRSWRAS